MDPATMATLLKAAADAIWRLFAARPSTSDPHRRAVSVGPVRRSR
jgi:hypothetical protein